MGTEKTFTLKTKAGCWRLFLILLAAILIFSCCAQLITTCGGRIKVEKITIDARGATLEGDLYYPAGITDRQKLPAVIVAHGAGVSKGNYKGIAEELARRDFVVFNINGYGTAGSEMPPYDEYDQGVEAFNMWGTCSGLLDATEFIRTLDFVDQTRIGYAGHSQGSFRAEFACMKDVPYLTFNDVMINVLHEQFGQEFTEEEILQDAGTLAEDRLSDDQLVYYNYLRAEKEEWYNTRVKTICIIGTSGSHIVPRQTVMVGGHEVLRNCQINLSVICGTFDSTAFVTKDYALDSFFVPGEIATETWYAVDDIAQTGTVVGKIGDSVATNTALAEAVDKRQARFVAFNVETHSKNFFSVATTSDVVEFCTQTLKYNRGDLENAQTAPLDAKSSVFVWREICNFLAMCAMVGMMAPLAGILVKTPFFESCVGKNEMNTNKYSKKRSILTACASVIIGFICMYWLNTIFAPFLKCDAGHPWWPVYWLGAIFLSMFAGFSLVELVVFYFLDKKTIGVAGIKAANINLPLSGILKTLLLSVILLISGYMSLAVVKYLFNQDFRLWMFAFDEMKVEYWGWACRMFLIMFAQFLIIGAALNYSRDPDTPEWLAELKSVIFGSLGVWLVALINILVLHAGRPQFSAWQFTYQFLFAVPLNIYLCRRLYKVTKSVWLGAFVNAFLLAWSFLAAGGYNTYCPQGVFSLFFHA